MRQRVIVIGLAMVAALVAALVVAIIDQPTSKGPSTIQAASPTALSVLTPTPSPGTPSATIPTPAPTATSIDQNQVVTVVGVGPHAGMTTVLSSTQVVWVVTARHAILQDTTIYSSQVSDLFTRTLLAAPAPPGALSTVSDVASLVGTHGRLITTTLLTGAPLALTDIGLGDNQAALLSMMPAGDVAVSFNSMGAAGLPNILLPGDDVIVVALPAHTGAHLPLHRADPITSLGTGRVLAIQTILPDAQLDNRKEQMTLATTSTMARSLLTAIDRGASIYLLLRGHPGGSTPSPIIAGPTALPTPMPPIPPPSTPQTTKHKT